MSDPQNKSLPSDADIIATVTVVIRRVLDPSGTLRYISEVQKNVPFQLAAGLPR